MVRMPFLILFPPGWWLVDHMVPPCSYLTHTPGERTPPGWYHTQKAGWMLENRPFDYSTFQNSFFSQISVSPSATAPESSEWWNLTRNKKRSVCCSLVCPLFGNLFPVALLLQQRTLSPCNDHTHTVGGTNVNNMTKRPQNGVRQKLCEQKASQRNISWVLANWDGWELSENDSHLFPKRAPFSEMHLQYELPWPKISVTSRNISKLQSSAQKQIISTSYLRKFIQKSAPSRIKCPFAIAA